MCGIAGTVFRELAVEQTDQALQCLANRGPDSRRALTVGACTLIHTRLAVIDLSDSAGQPMVSRCGRYTIVFNGEIYNYEELRNSLLGSYDFQTHSDTEVLLALYATQGHDMLERLRGMFALAIWDRERESLLIARDRIGVKPLYIADTKRGFAFASRPDVLRVLAPEATKAIDPQALRYYLEAGYVPAPLSFYRGVRKVEPGQAMTVTRHGVTSHRYWSLDSCAVNPALEDAAEGELLDELDALIQESVRLRMVSDVPIGAFLSGGIDSSLVVAHMMKLSSKPVKTFTIGFREAAFDESTRASAIAAHLGTDHRSETLSVDDLLSFMPTFTKQYDEPFFDYSAFPVMAVSRLARKTVTVSLSGDGGDESFGGYHYYRIMHGLDRLRHVPSVGRRLAAGAMQLMPAQRARWLGHVVGMDGAAAPYAFMRGVIKDASRLMTLELLTTTESLADLFARRIAGFPPKLDYAQVGMRLDLAYTLPDDYLQKVDIGSMAFSLEARDPLLDHRIIEWGARLPLRWKLQGKTNKYLLRQLAYRHIPRQLLDHPKMGFSLPMADWLRGGLRQWGEELLSDDDALDVLYLNATEVRRLWAAHQSGRVQAHTALWSVLVLLQFYRSRVNPR